MRAGLIALSMGLLLGVAPSPPLAAQEPKQDCPAVAAPLPAELSGWAARRPIAAAADPDRLAPATLAVGAGVDAALKSTKDLHYVVRPEKPGGSVSYGGLFRLDIAQAGTYRVALSSGAWIDLLRGKEALVSTAHGHGPDCSGIRKMVDFALAPGRYTLQIAANGEPALSLLVARLP